MRDGEEEVGSMRYGVYTVRTRISVPEMWVPGNTGLTKEGFWSPEEGSEEGPQTNMVH